MKKIYDNPHKTRRAVISFARKNAKTTLAGFLLLLHLVGPEHVPNSQLYSAAQSRDQAAIIFALCAKIVRMSPELNPYITIRDTAKELLCPDIGTKYKALSAEVSTAYGLSPVFIVYDELGQVQGPISELYEALETAVAAQDEPLSVIISTQAPTDNDLLSIIIDDAKSGNDPRTVLSLYTADINADPFAEETIKQANPAFGDFQNAQEVLAMASDASRMPSREAQFRNLILNQRVQASNPFISKKTWDECKGKLLKFLPKTKVYGGLDLSATRDLTSAVFIGEVEKVWQVHPTFWLPKDGIEERSRLDRVPYDVWADHEYLELTPGKSIEYEFVAEYLRGIFDEYNVIKLAFDRWQFRHLRPWLLKAGFTEKEIEEKFIEFGQGFQSMSPALRHLESLILNKKIAHGGHPVLTMCAANAVVNTDPAGNRKLDKAKSHGRIDGMVSLTMAAAVSENTVEEPVKKYQMLFV